VQEAAGLGALASTTQEFQTWFDPACPKCDHTFMLKDMHRMPLSTAGDSVRQTRIDAAAAYRLLCRPLKFWEATVSTLMDSISTETALKTPSSGGQITWPRHAGSK